MDLVTGINSEGSKTQLRRRQVPRSEGLVSTGHLEENVAVGGEPKGADWTGDYRETFEE